MKILDMAEALRLMREVVGERPDYVYRQPEDGDGCQYEYLGQPSCLVGHVLARAGWTAEQLHDLDVAGVVADQLDELSEGSDRVTTTRAAQILRQAQAVQDAAAIADTGSTWTDALLAAEAMAGAS